MVGTGRWAASHIYVHKVFFDLIPTVQRSKEIFIIEFAMAFGFWLLAFSVVFLALYIYNLFIYY
jgi:hypothetical protein